MTGPRLRRQRADRKGFHADDRGGAAVEFAISAPVLIMLSLGTVEIGRVTLAYHDLSLATFEAGRYAMDHWKLALFAFGPIGAAVYLVVTNLDKVRAAVDAITDAIKTLVESRLHGIDTSKVSLTVDWDPSNNPGGFATISLSYPFKFLAGFIPNLTLSSTLTTIVAN